MSRLSQAIDYINVNPKNLTKDYIKNNYTDIVITDSLKKLRRTNLKSNNKNKN